MRAFFPGRGVLRRFAATHLSGAAGNHPRYFADRGLNRKDYTDPGYQKSGYICPSWFSHTHEGKFKSPKLPRAPVYAGSVKDEEELRKKMKKRRRMGEARKQFECWKTNQDQNKPQRAPEVREFDGSRSATNSSSSSSEVIKPPKIDFQGEIVPELELLETARRNMRKKKKEASKLARRRTITFKGRVLREDYDDFEYRGSGLDDYTNRLLEKEEKKKQEQEEV